MRLVGGLEPARACELARASALAPADAVERVAAGKNAFGKVTED